MQLYSAKVQHFFYLAKNISNIFLEKMYLCNILIFRPLFTLTNLLLNNSPVTMFERIMVRTRSRNKYSMM